MHVIGPRVLVRPIETPRPRSSVLYIPETVDPVEPSKYALVVAVGNGYPKKDGTREPLDVKVGDTVIVRKYSMNPISVNGEPVSVVMHQDVLAVVEMGVPQQ